MRFGKLLTFLLVLLLAGCARIKEPEFRKIGGFRVKNFGLQEAVIGLNVTYFNPNNFGVTVKEAGADVYLDTVYLGRFVQDSSVAVNRSAEFSIPLSGAVSLQKVLQLNLRDLAQREVLLRADGSVKVGKAGVFITKSFQYQGRHRVDDFSLYQ